jgi:hypothetical protein
MKPTPTTHLPERPSMSLFARHNRPLPRTRAALSAMAIVQGAMNNGPRFAALAPPGLPTSRIP